MFTALVDGAKQGVNDFVADLSSLSITDVAAELATAGAGLAQLPDLTDAVNAFTAALSSGYSALLPIADLVNALVTTMPAYNVSLFAQELAQGDLLDALLMPIAADIGLATTGIGIGLMSVLSAVMPLPL